MQGTKTDAAERTVDVLPLLRDELAARAVHSRRGPEALVFATSTGAKFGATNVRRRVLAAAVERANGYLGERYAETLPEGLTRHSLGHLRLGADALGETPPYVMAQMGHTTPDLALAIYAREMDRRDGEPERLRALVRGEVWVPTGTSADRGAFTPETQAA